MKLSYQIVVAALVGTMSHTEVVQALERHHHHNSDYVQFISDVPQSEVRLTKDYGFSQKQVLAIQEPEVEAAAAGATKEGVETPAIKPTESTDENIKLPKVTANIEEATPSKEALEKKEIEDGNAEKKKTEESKATAEAMSKVTADSKDEGTSMKQIMGAIDEAQVKENIKEKEAAMKNPPKLTEEEKEAKFNEFVNEKADEADKRAHIKKVQKLQKAIDTETEEDYKGKLEVKLKAAQEVVAKDAVSETAIAEKEEAEKESEAKKVLDAQKAIL